MPPLGGEEAGQAARKQGSFTRGKQACAKCPPSSGSALGDSWPGRVVINRRPAGHAMPALATRRRSTTLHAGPGIGMDVGLVWGLWLWLWLGDRPLSTSCSTPHPTPHPQLLAAMGVSGEVSCQPRPPSPSSSSRRRGPRLRKPTPHDPSSCLQTKRMTQPTNPSKVLCIPPPPQLHAHQRGRQTKNPVIREAGV